MSVFDNAHRDDDRPIDWMMNVQVCVHVERSMDTVGHWPFANRIVGAHTEHQRTEQSANRNS